MTVNVYLDSSDALKFQALQFVDVEGFSFYSGRDNSTGKSVAQWTKFLDDNPSQEWVNLDPTKLVISSVDLFDGALCAYARSLPGDTKIVWGLPLGNTMPFQLKA